MIKLLIIAAVLYLAYLGFQQIKPTEQQIKESAPVRYTEGLKTSVEKAKDASEKANETIKRQTEDLKKAVQAIPE